MGDGAVDYSTRGRFVLTISHEDAPEVVLDLLPGRPDKRRKAGSLPGPDQALPYPDIGFGSRVKRRRIWDADLELVPPAPLDGEAEHVLHQRHVDEARSPLAVGVGESPEIPRQPAEHEEMIRTV